MSEKNISREEIDALYDELKQEAGDAGYHFNPDVQFAKDLVRSLIVNEDRYGYRACPCRLAAGVREADLDIICPCDYRDPDLSELGACFCALYVSGAVARGEKKAESIPERRPPEEERKNNAPLPRGGAEMAPGKVLLPYPVYRCKVCGYLCARDEPPETCPVCKAGKDRFERFM